MLTGLRDSVIEPDEGIEGCRGLSDRFSGFGREPLATGTGATGEECGYAGGDVAKKGCNVGFAANDARKRCQYDCSSTTANELTGVSHDLVLANNEICIFDGIRFIDCQGVLYIFSSIAHGLPELAND